MTSKQEIPRLVPGSGLTNYPPPDMWDDWVEWDAKAWPEKKANRFRLVPTTCFNCESACGLLGYVDKETGQIRRFEGNPRPPRLAGPQLRKGAGDDQPGKRPREDPPPAETVGTEGLW